MSSLYNGLVEFSIETRSLRTFEVVPVFDHIALEYQFANFVEKFK